MTCQIPPSGWRCTREAGHEGPCAALPSIRRPCKIVVSVFTAIVDADGCEVLVCGPSNGMSETEVANEVLALLNGDKK